MTSVERLWEEARRHETAGRREKAVECYEQIVEQRRAAGEEDEVDPSIHLSLGDLHYRLGRGERAFRSYQRAASRYVELGSARNAESLQRLCLRLFPGNPEPHLRLAELYFRTGDPERARQEIYQVAKEARDVVPSSGPFVDALRRYVTGEDRDLFAGRVVALLRSQESLRDLFSWDEMDRLSSGEAILREPPSAGVEERGAGADPDAPSASGPASAGRPRSASDEARAGSPGDGSRSRRPSWLSDEALGVEEGEAARELGHGLEVVEEMLQVHPHRVDLLQRRAIYARKLGDRELLIDAWLDLADALRGERGSRGARLLYHRVLEVDPENERALRALRPVDRAAVRAAAEGNGAAAVAVAVEEGMSRPDFERQILQEFSQESDPLRWLEAAAESALTAGSEAKERPLEFYEFFGRYLMARGRWDAAASVLEKGLSLHEHSTEESDRAEARFALGLALRQGGRHGRARSQFEKLAELEPGFRMAWEAVPDPKVA